MQELPDELLRLEELDELREAKAVPPTRPALRAASAAPARPSSRVTASAATPQVQTTALKTWSHQLVN